MEELRKALNDIFDQCYSKDLSVCSKHTIFQRGKAVNMIIIYLESKGNE